MKKVERPDPIEEIREIRRRISARFGNDPVRLAEHSMEYQKQLDVPLVTEKSPEGKKNKPAA